MTKDIRLATSVVPIESLRPNTWNPNKQSDFIYEKEKTSISTFGFVDPITVRENGHGYEIIDGFHRWRAAKDLGFKEVPINSLGALSDAHAKELTIILNELRGEYDPLKLAEVVKGLSETEGMDALAKVLPFTAQEIENLVKVTDFNWDQFKPGEAPGASAGEGEDEWVTLEFRVPQAAAQVVNQAITRLVDGLGLEGKTATGRALELLAADSLSTPLESYN